MHQIIKNSAICDFWIVLRERIFNAKVRVTLTWSKLKTMFLQAILHVSIIQCTVCKVNIYIRECLNTQFPRISIDSRNFVFVTGTSVRIGISMPFSARFSRICVFRYQTKARFCLTPNRSRWVSTDLKFLHCF